MATSRDGGDVVYHGDEVSFTRAQDIEPGLLVTPSGDMEVDKADVSGAGENVVGVMTDANMSTQYGDYGAKYTVRMAGVVKLRVEDGTLGAGDEVYVPDTASAGTPGVGIDGGATGAVGSGYTVVRGAEQDDDGYHVLAKLD